MKKSTLVKLLVAVMLVALMLSVGAVAAFATDEATETNHPSILGTDSEGNIKTIYGTVPAEKAEYTFAVFVKKDGEYIWESSYNIFNIKGSGAMHRAVQLTDSKEYPNYDDNKIIILYLKDYQAPTDDHNHIYSNYIKDTITVDMNGFTHTLNEIQLFRLTDADNTEKGEVIFKNGKIIIGTTSLFRFGGSTPAGTYKFTFDNVTFGYPENSKLTTNLIDVYRKTTAAGTSEHTLNFTDCTFDLSNAPAGHTIFSAQNFTSTSVEGAKLILHYTFKGCEIKANSPDDFTIKGDFNDDSTLTFAKGSTENPYLCVTLPTGEAAPQAPEEGLAFVERSNDGVTTTYMLVPEAAANLGFTPKASVTLDSNLIFNMYLPETDGVSIDEVTLNGEKKTLGEAVDGYYLITEELPAYDAAKELTLVVNLTVNGTPLKGTFTFSTVKYAEKLIELNGNDDTKAEVTLAKDMLSYIRSAYNYFENVTAEDKTAVTAAINEILGSYNVTTLKPVTVPEKSGDREILAGATLVLESTPAFRFVLEAGVAAEGYTFKIGNKVLAYTTGSFVDNDVTYNYYDISLYAYEMVEEITVTKGEASANYHINFYYQGVDTEDTELVDIVTKFYNYCASARAYRNSVINK